MSKLLKIPEFKPLPPFTDAANVEENIQFWIKENKQNNINNYLIADTSAPHRYRFINSYDLTDTIEFKQSIQGVDITVVYKRFYYCHDHFCPLDFSEMRTDITLSFPNNETFEYCSDADLKRKIKTYKQSIA